MYHGKHSKNILTFNNLRRKVNATGETIAKANVTKSKARVNDIIRVTNCSSGTKLACFSSHEARGTGSVVRYLAEKF